MPVNNRNIDENVFSRNPKTKNKIIYFLRYSSDFVDIVDSTSKDKKIDDGFLNDKAFRHSLSNLPPPLNDASTRWYLRTQSSANLKSAEPIQVTCGSPISEDLRTRHEIKS